MSKRVDIILRNAAQKASEETHGTAKPEAILKRLKRMYDNLPSSQRNEFLDTLLQVESRPGPKFTLQKRKAWIIRFCSALFMVITRRFHKPKKENRKCI